MAAVSEKTSIEPSDGDDGLKDRKIADEETVISEKRITDLEHVPISQEDLDTLRRTPGPINLAAYLIAICELVERFSYYGVTAVLVNFIQQVREQCLMLRRLQAVARPRARMLIRLVSLISSPC